MTINNKLFWRLCFASLIGLLAVSQSALADASADTAAMFANPAPRVVGAYISLGYWDLQDVDQAMDELQASGVNLVIDYALTPPEDESWEPALERYLLIAQDHGIRVAFVLFPLLEGLTPAGPGEQMDKVVNTVAQLKKWPQISAWYVHDEVLPHLQGVDGTMKYGISLDEMVTLYQRIKAVDPERPQLNVWCSLPQYDNFCRMYGPECTPCGRPGWMCDPLQYEEALRRLIQDTCDWVMIDSYPIGAPWRTEATTTPVQDISLLVSRAAQLKRSEQPLLFVFQSFSWAQYGKGSVKDAPFPSMAEMYSMLYTAWDAGARGAIAYSWFDLVDHDTEGSKVKGREQCLRALKRTLGSLSDPAWPNCEPPEF